MLVSIANVTIYDVVLYLCALKRYLSNCAAAKSMPARAAHFCLFDLQPLCFLPTVL